MHADTIVSHGAAVTAGAVWSHTELKFFSERHLADSAQPLSSIDPGTFSRKAISTPGPACSHVSAVHRDGF